MREKRRISQKIYPGTRYNIKHTTHFQYILYKTIYSPSTKSPSNIVNIPSTDKIPVICDPLGVSCPPSVSSPSQLQVYSRRHRSQQSLCDSTQVSTSLFPLAPTTKSDLPPSDPPIALQKGIRSTCNPSPHYVALSYHRLSSPFYTCLSSISFVTIPKFICDALVHPCWY